MATCINKECLSAKHFAEYCISICILLCDTALLCYNSPQLAESVTVQVALSYHAMCLLAGYKERDNGAGRPGGGQQGRRRPPPSCQETGC